MLFGWTVKIFVVQEALDLIVLGWFLFYFWHKMWAHRMGSTLVVKFWFWKVYSQRLAAIAMHTQLLFMLIIKVNFCVLHELKNSQNDSVIEMFSNRNYCWERNVRFEIKEDWYKLERATIIWALHMFCQSSPWTVNTKLRN